LKGANNVTSNTHFPSDDDWDKSLHIDRESWFKLVGAVSDAYCFGDALEARDLLLSTLHHLAGEPRVRVWFVRHGNLDDDWLEFGPYAEDLENPFSDASEFLEHTPAFSIVLASDHDPNEVMMRGLPDVPECLPCDDEQRARDAIGVSAAVLWLAALGPLNFKALPCGCIEQPFDVIVQPDDREWIEHSERLRGGDVVQLFADVLGTTRKRAVATILLLTEHANGAYRPRRLAQQYIDWIQGLRRSAAASKSDLPREPEPEKRSVQYASRAYLVAAAELLRTQTAGAYSAAGDLKDVCCARAALRIIEEHLNAEGVSQLPLDCEKAGVNPAESAEGA
jgi:hypothetical protein